MIPFLDGWIRTQGIKQSLHSWLAVLAWTCAWGLQPWHVAGKCPTNTGRIGCDSRMTISSACFLSIIGGVPGCLDLDGGIAAIHKSKWGLWNVGRRGWLNGRDGLGAVGIESVFLVLKGWQWFSVWCVHALAGLLHHDSEQIKAFRGLYK